MADSESGTEAEGGAATDPGPDADGGAGGTPPDDRDADAEDLERAVDERYDFEDFGPADMASMTGEEWEAAFDADTWITGPELLDRVEADLRARIADRDVFAVVERDEIDGEQRLVAYSDEGFALVYEDGTVEGSGTVLRDVKPTVALASMDSYEVPAVPEDAGRLPEPAEVPTERSEVGNRVMMVVAGVQVLAGLFLLGAWIALGLSVIVPVVAFGFLLFGAFLFVVVANARLSDRFRAEEFRDRLRAAGVESGERPPFVPGPDEPSRGTPDGGGQQEVGDGDPDPVESGDAGPATDEQ